MGLTPDGNEPKPVKSSRLGKLWTKIPRIPAWKSNGNPVDTVEKPFSEEISDPAPMESHGPIDDTKKEDTAGAVNTKTGSWSPLNKIRTRIPKWRSNGKPVPAEAKSVSEDTSEPAPVESPVPIADAKKEKPVVAENSEPGRWERSPFGKLWGRIPTISILGRGSNGDDVTTEENHVPEPISESRPVKSSRFGKVRTRIFCVFVKSPEPKDDTKKKEPAVAVNSESGLWERSPLGKLWIWIPSIFPWKSHRKPTPEPISEPEPGKKSFIGKIWTSIWGKPSDDKGPPSELPETPRLIRITAKVLRPVLETYKQIVVASIEKGVKEEVKRQYLLMGIQLSLLTAVYLAVYLTDYSLLSRRIASAVLWCLIIFNTLSMKRNLVKLMAYYNYLKDKDVALALAVFEISVSLIAPCFTPLILCLVLSFSARAFVASSFDLIAPWTEAPSLAVMAQSLLHNF